jgi:hypothetical protein
MVLQKALMVSLIHEPLLVGMLILAWRNGSDA